MPSDVAETPRLDAQTERDVPELQPGSQFAKRYRVETHLGSGAMGAVFRVKDEKLGEIVALKLLTIHSPKAIDRFRREVRLARRVTHSNVARTHDLGESEGIHFLTMEYVPGKALDRIIEERGRFGVAEVLLIGAGIAAGLEAAHAAGVIHRDLKPGNVLIAEDGRVVLTDFGIARAAEGEMATHRTGDVVGTPLYMSPEQVGGRRADHRSDIYSLGLILFELATGCLPIEGEHALAIAVARLREAPADPRTLVPDLPPELAALILRCLAIDLSARPQSATEVRTLLEAIDAPHHLAAPVVIDVSRGRGASTESVVRTMSQADALPVARSRWIWAVPVLLTMLGVGGLVALWPRPTAPPAARVTAPTPPPAPIAAPIAVEPVALPAVAPALPEVASPQQPHRASRRRASRQPPPQVSSEPRPASEADTLAHNPYPTAPR